MDNDTPVRPTEYIPATPKITKIKSTETITHPVTSRGYENEVMYVCRTINTLAPLIQTYTKIGHNVPANFHIFAVADKLSLMVTSLQASLSVYLEYAINENADIANNITYRDARENIQKVTVGFESLIDRLRQSAYDMPTVKVQCPAAGGVAAGH